MVAGIVRMALTKKAGGLKISKKTIKIKN